MNDADWYMPFIILVFASYPVLRVLQRRGWALLAVSAIWLVVSAVTFRHNANPAISLLHFGSVFLIGMAFSRFRSRLESFGAEHFWPVVACSIAIFVVTAPFILEDPDFYEQVFHQDMLTVNSAFVGKLGLIPAVALILKRMGEAGWTLTPLSFLANISFGLYFWHFYLIYGTAYILAAILRRLGTPDDVALYLIYAGQVVMIFGVLSALLLLVRRLAGPRSVYLTGF